MAILNFKLRAAQVYICLGGCCFFCPVFAQASSLNDIKQRIMTSSSQRMIFLKAHDSQNLIPQIIENRQQIVRKEKIVGLTDRLSQQRQLLGLVCDPAISEIQRAHCKAELQKIDFQITMLKKQHAVEAIEKEQNELVALFLDKLSSQDKSTLSNLNNGIMNFFEQLRILMPYPGIVQEFCDSLPDPLILF
jgi:hypothetical protein